MPSIYYVCMYVCVVERVGHRISAVICVAGEFHPSDDNILLCRREHCIAVKPSEIGVRSDSIFAD